MYFLKNNAAKRIQTDFLHIRLSRLILLILLSLGIILFLAACNDSDSDNKTMTISSDFESGSISWAEEQSWQNWDIYLKDDNDDSSLRDSYRNWWYIRLDNVSQGQTVTLTLKNRGWSYYYLPVYSYDQRTWHRFSEDEVSTSNGCQDGLEGCTLKISTDRFTKSQVYLARFYPYTTKDLDRYLEKITKSPYVTVTSLGQSSGYGEEISLVRIEDPDVPDTEKQAVWMHARSHPAETGSSFMVEGAINQVLKDMESGDPAARSLVYYIVPMHNVDGVIAGNYRTDLYSRNFEIEWIPDDEQSLFISKTSAPENQLLNAEMAWLIHNTDYRGDLIALNLHSSNSLPDMPAFAYPHFGDDTETYSPQEISLWHKSTHLIELITDHYNGYFSPPPDEGGSGFTSYPFPETWWWENMKDDCLAMTIETVYSKAGFDYWITPDNIRELGAAVTMAIYDYYNSEPAQTQMMHLMSISVDKSRIPAQPRRIDLPDEISSKL